MQDSAAKTAIDVGTVIAGTYTIEALVGRGGMGSVFLASHKRLPGKQVAIKMLHADVSSDEVLARFKREAEIASRLGHPNICAVHDFNVLPDGTPYLVLDYLSGESLAQRLKRGPLPLDQVLSIVRQVGSALAAAHREGIIHRDLKPQNIFLVPTEIDGKIIEIAKVLDFGISKVRDSDTVKTQESALLGTPQYMAPEQANSQNSAIDERTDIFAFGAIVYEMLAGRPAFSGSSIPEVVYKVVHAEPAPLAADVPPAVVSAIAHAMAKAASSRYSSVSAFVEALTGQPVTTSSTGGRPISIPPPLAPTGPPTPGRRPGGNNSGNDAFAQTIGSGDHGVVITDAPTLGTVSPSASPSASASDVGVPARRSPALLIGGLLVVGAAIAFVIYFATSRRDGEVIEHEHEHERVVETNVVPPVVTPTTPAPTTPVAKPAKPVPPTKRVDLAKVTTPPPTTPPPTTPPPTTPPPTTPPPTTPAGTPPTEPAEAAADATTSEKLKAAEAALNAEDYAKAEELANSIILGEHAGRNQKAHAHTLHGIVACAHNSEEKAQIDLRQLDGYPKLRRRLLSACHAQGELTSLQ